MKVRIEREPFLRPEGIGPGGDRGDEDQVPTVQEKEKESERILINK
jgi:hypothetical protein